MGNETKAIIAGLKSVVLIESLQAQNAELKKELREAKRDISELNNMPESGLYTSGQYAELKEENATLRATAELVPKWEESAGLARYYLEGYSDDADHATHAKRVLDNALEALGESVPKTDPAPNTPGQ